MSRTAPPGPLSTQVHRQAELMDQMTHALAIDRAAAVRLDCGRAFAQARTQCLHCQNSRACEEWLASAECPSSPPALLRRHRLLLPPQVRHAVGVTTRHPASRAPDLIRGEAVRDLPQRVDLTRSRTGALLAFGSHRPVR